MSNLVEREVFVVAACADCDWREAGTLVAGGVDDAAIGAQRNSKGEQTDQKRDESDHPGRSRPPCHAVAARKVR